VNNKKSLYLAGALLIVSVFFATLLGFHVGYSAGVNDGQIDAIVSIASTHN